MSDGLKTSIGIWAFGTLGTRFLHGRLSSGGRRRGSRRARPAGRGRASRSLRRSGAPLPGRDRRRQSADMIASHQADGHVLRAHRGRIRSRNTGEAHLPTPTRRFGKKPKRPTVEASTSAAQLGAQLHHLARHRGIQLSLPVRLHRRSGPCYSTASGTPSITANANRRHFFLEHKNSEPQMKIYMRDMGMSIFVIRQLERMGLDVSATKDQHGLAAPDHERREPGGIRRGAGHGGLAGPPTRQLGLGHNGRRQYRRRHAIYGDPGAGPVAAKSRIRTNGERLGIDLYPYTEDAIRPRGRACSSGASSTTSPAVSTRPRCRRPRIKRMRWRRTGSCTRRSA